MTETWCNYAFVDWQNLHLWTTKGDPSRSIDFKKLRRYLKENYKITKAYYFMWYVKDEHNSIYTNLQDAWFLVIFKKQLVQMKSEKKWNIDTQLVFSVMEKLIEEPNEFDKILIISWDWDFKVLVDYLVKKARFLKILFPNKDFASSLYNKLGSEFFDFMINIKTHIEYTHHSSAKKDSDIQKKSS